MDLTNKTLFRQQNYINGQWVNAHDGATFEVHNPFDESLIGVVPKMGQKETAAAIQAADDAFQSWRQTTAQERSKLIRRWAELIDAHQNDLSRIMTYELGKPLAESLGEIAYGNSFNYWFAEEGPRVYGDIIPTIHQDRRLLVIKQPVGVCCAVTPWNFPMAMIARKAAPALMAGCTMVIKPAESTPYSALALAALAEEALIPAGVLNIITGDPVVIGQEFSSNPQVKKLSFTGSTRVGKLLMQQCAGTVKKLALELGGNAPFIVFEDADVVRAVAGLMVAKFRNTGQACVAANRVYVHDQVFDEFTKLLLAQLQQIKVGNGLHAGSTLGPLINKMAVEKVDGLVKDAIQKGAKLLFGGKRDPSSPNAYQPTLLTEVNEKAILFSEEIFGPVIAIYRFKDEQDVIQKANHTSYGLASYFYTKELSRAWRVAEALEYGMVSINEGLFSTTVAPFGGVKESGFGREGSKYGIDDYLNIKYLCMGL
ncbi:MAG: NAD-dependent succinate-semialdehyde dehydrogenase [Legionellales bacterium]|nr:NAD-dependent succinate-semialdehyde dehydrogenase [Legionellales bacterium]